LPIGLATALVLGAVVLVAAGLVAGERSAGSRAPSPSTPTSGITTNTTATSSVYATATIVAAPIRVAGVQAHLWPDGKYLTVALAITNSSKSSVKLVGVSSPVAALAGLYGTTDCPSGDNSDLCGKVPYAFWRIDPGETVQLRPGDGEIILGEFTSPVVAGQTIPITLKFDGSPEVMLTAVVAG
jgi:copper(I)-binding protein